MSDPLRSTEEALRRAESTAQTMANRMRAVAGAAAGVIGAESLQRLRDVLHGACARVIPFDAFTFGLYDAERGVLSFLEGWDAGVFVPEEEYPIAGTPTERVLAERRSMLTLRADDPAGAGAHIMGTGRRSESIIRAPILTADDALGVLSVQSYTRDAYAPEDVEVLEAIASLASTAIGNIRLEVERSAAEHALRASEAEIIGLFHSVEYDPDYDYKEERKKR
jgi:transcriptional regulator with GAF, ATPase, and Fis domain